MMISKNPVLGTIPNIEHHIEIEGNPTNYATAYRVPIKIRDKVDDEIQKLADLEIIRKSTRNFISQHSQY